MGSTNSRVSLSLDDLRTLIREEVATARGSVKSAKSNTFVADVIRAPRSHTCTQCGKAFKSAERALPANHWHPKA